MALTLVNTEYVENATTGTTAIVTGSFTPAAGELLVVKIVNGDANQTFGTIAVTGFTLVSSFVSQVNVGTDGASCRVGIWTAFVNTSAAGTVSSGTFTNSRARAMAVERWTGASLAGTPSTSSTVADATTPWTSTLTTAQNGSVASYVLGDWNAIDPATTAFSGDTATPTRSHADTFLTGSMTVWWLSQVAATAGAQTIGISAPSGITTTTAAIEIQDASGGGTDATVTFPQSITIHP